MRTIALLVVGIVCGVCVSAFAQASYRVYVTNETSGDLTIIDGEKLKAIRTTPLGKRPRGLHASPDGRLLYVAMSGSPSAPPGIDESKLPRPDKTADGIGVYDVKAGRIVRVIKGVSDPEQLAVSPDGKRLYVASEDSGVAIILDAERGTKLGTVDVGGEPEGTAATVDGKYIYMTSETDGRLSIIDTGTFTVAKQIPVGKRPRGVAFSSDGARAVVSGETDGSLTLIDMRTQEPVKTLHLDSPNARPMGVVIAPDSTIYVATGRGGRVVALDGKTYAVRGEVEVGPRPWNIALRPDSKLLFTANGPSNDVSVVNTSSMRVIAKIPVGKDPWGVVVVKEGE